MLTRHDSDLVFKFDADVMPEDSGVVESRTFELSFCIDTERLPLGAFCKFEEILYNLPLWAKLRLGYIDIEKIPVAKRTDDLYPANWNAERWREYARYILSMLSCVYTGDAALMKVLRGYDYSFASDVRMLENFFVDVYGALHSREKKEIEYFTHKGKKYRVPADPLTARQYLTWLEASTALQSDWSHSKVMTNVSAPKGEILRNSSMIVAALAREVRTDKSTGISQAVPPSKDPKKAEEALIQRIADFQDLPTSIAIGVGFFLSVSIMRSNMMLSLALPLSHMSHHATQRGALLHARQ